MSGRSTGRYSTYSTIGGNVGVGVGVAMGVMVGIANVSVRESVVATKGNRGIWSSSQFTDLACIITSFALTSIDIIRNSFIKSLCM